MELAIDIIELFIVLPALVKLVEKAIAFLKKPFFTVCLVKSYFVDFRYIKKTA